MNFRCFGLASVVVACAFVLGPAASTDARPVTSMDLLTLRDVGGVSMSPDGRFVVYQVRRADSAANAYSNQWFLIEVATKQQRIIVGNGGEPILSGGDWQTYAPVWSGKSDAFCYVRKDGGRITVHRMTLDGQDKPIVVGKGDLVDFRANDIGVAYVALEDATPETVRVAQENLRNGYLFALGYPSWTQEKINQFAPWLGRPDFSAEKVRAGYDVDVQTGVVRPQPKAPGSTYVPDELTHGIPDFRFAMYATLSPDGKSEAFCATTKAKGKPSEQHAIYSVPPQGGEVTRLSSLTEEPIRQLAWSTDGRHIYFLRATDYTDQNLFVADPSTNQSRQLTKLPGYLDSCSFAGGALVAACTVESLQRPQEIAVVHLDTGAVDVLTDLNPEFNKLEKTPTEKLVWTNKHGDVMYGVLTYPRGYRPGTRYPMAITTYRAHGFLRGAVGDEYPVDVFAANGLMVVAVDIYNTSYVPVALDQEQPFDVTILDWQSPLDGIEQIVGELAKRGLIDKERVGISGLSHGSEITNYAISHSSTFAAAIADGGSARDPLFYYLKSESWNTMFKSWGLEGPPYEANLPKWQQMSPALNAGRITAPLLMNAPDSEYVIGLQQYWEMRDHHRPVEMWIFPDEDHIKHQPVHRLVVYDRNVDWFNYWLREVRDPDPSKGPQYKRWDALRAERDASRR
ncbi:MAG TPA: Atxe2 family lasso peptide isopeptidase [Candidatus Paceibacterota bacterium]|nr:Atxe2 family lasso peptide isopeptidase [Candidatus Paceibacterota bacterium]